MNWDQFKFKDPVSDMCLAGDVVASWSLTQEEAGLSPFNDIFFVPEFAESSETIRINSNDSILSLYLILDFTLYITEAKRKL